MSEPSGESIRLESVDLLARIARRIRAGWLPHRLGVGSWWWGRPANDDGFRLWTEGLVPSMSEVERMNGYEAMAWIGATSSEHNFDCAGGRPVEAKSRLSGSVPQGFEAPPPATVHEHDSDGSAPQ